MKSFLHRLLLGIVATTLQIDGKCQPDPNCSNRFPEGGYCTQFPTSPFCNPSTSRCNMSKDSDGCSCCRNCFDNGCSQVGEGWSCVNKTVAMGSKERCIDGQGLCLSSNQGESKCYCCPPNDPMPCQDEECREVGGKCFKEHKLPPEEICNLFGDKLCFEQDGYEPCICCVPVSKPCSTGQECEKRGPGYSCVLKEDAVDWPVPCEHSCFDDGTRDCLCCPPKPPKVDCKDNGCSKMKGYECKNASVASQWPKRCLESEVLCPTITEEYEIGITADNAFGLYGDGSTIGNGNDWQQCYTFPSDASKVLAVVAKDYGGYEGVILSTTTGVITDSTWKCISSELVSSLDWASPDFNDMSWPYAQVVGSNGDFPWGPKPCIIASAKWIWAPISPLTGKWPDKVYCRKRLRTPRCYCCPPKIPENNCTDTGCGEAFGEGSLGECIDVTNPDFSSLSSTHDLLAKPSGENLCKNTLEDSCCRCFKKKPCIDEEDRCQQAFRGDGICVDVEVDDLSTIDLSVEKQLGLCKNALKKDCCFCYKKHTDQKCYQKSCMLEGMKGQCIASSDPPPPNHVKTNVICKGKDCLCWVPEGEDCSSDPVCEESLHGKCVPNIAGASIPNHRPSTYKCQRTATQAKNCTCWTPYCENYRCKEQGGKCILPWERPPVGYEPNGLICNEKLDCKCYARKPCDINEECDNVGGKCRFPDDPNTADEVIVGGGGDLSLCDKDRGCECYRKPCSNPECTNERGICVSQEDQVPNPNLYSYTDGDFCIQSRNCKCYRPKANCKNTPKCANKGGRCLVKGMPIPAGSKKVLINGKHLKCQRVTDCYCWRVGLVIG